MSGLLWGALWALLFALLLSILQLFLPPNREPSFLMLTGSAAQAGCFSGVLYAGLVALWESAGDLPLRRGVVSAAAFPLATGRASQALWTCAFGAIAAVVANARPAR